MLTILSTAYLPPVEYLSLFAKQGSILIEKQEHFIKQTYRNRSLIATSNGVLALSIPVKKNGRNNCPIDQIEIDYNQPWQRTHWGALEAAYNSSPFFLYYKDYLQPFYFQKNIVSLIDFNAQLLNVLLRLFNLPQTWQYTTEYRVDYEKENDLRNIITPKNREKDDYPFKNRSYQQVFSDKNPFLHNLSSIDALFNEGKSFFVT